MRHSSRRWALSACLLLAACHGSDGPGKADGSVDAGGFVAGDKDASAADAGTDTGADASADGGAPVPVVCVTDRTCVAHGQLCDLERSLCVDCVRSVDCDPDERCDLGSCQPQLRCVDSLDCVHRGDAEPSATHLSICHTALRECVQCEHDADCSAGERCVDRGCERAAPSECSATGSCLDGGGSDASADAATHASADAGAVGPPHPPVGSCDEPPAVVFAIDGSGSMNDVYGQSGASRWAGVRAALFGGGTGSGVIEAVAPRMALSLLIYSGALAPVADPLVCMISPSLCVEGACPDIRGSEMPTLTTSAALQALLPDAPPGGTTPTHAALTEALAQLNAVPSTRRRAIVLLTDGRPNACNTTDTASAEAQVVEAASSIESAGVELLVVGVDAADPDLAAHLMAVANAAGTAPAALPFDADALRVQLTATLERLDCGP